MIRVVGEDQFFAFAARIREAAATFNGEVREEIEQSARGYEGRARRSARDTLPRRGGLGALIADTTSITVTPRDTGVVITASSPHNISGMDAGRVTHPLFGNRRHWYSERVNPEWWTKPVKETEPGARAGVEQAMENTKHKIEG